MSGSTTREQRVERAGKGSTNMVLRVMEQDGDCLQYCSHDHKRNKEVVLAAVRNAWRSLKHASHEMQDNQEVVLEGEPGHTPARVVQLCNHHSSAPSLLPCRTTAPLYPPAVKQDGYALRYASRLLQNDRAFVERCVAVGGFEAAQFAGFQVVHMEKLDGGGGSVPLASATAAYGWPGYGGGFVEKGRDLERARREAIAVEKYTIAPPLVVSPAVAAMEEGERWRSQRLRFGSRFR